MVTYFGYVTTILDTYFEIGKFTQKKCLQREDVVPLGSVQLFDVQFYWKQAQPSAEVPGNSFLLCLLRLPYPWTWTKVHCLGLSMTMSHHI